MPGEVAHLLVALDLDPGGLRAGLNASMGFISNFNASAQQALASSNIASQVGAGAMSQVRGLIRDMTDEFQASMGNLNERLAQGLIQPQAYIRAGNLAGLNFQQGVLGGLRELATTNLQVARNLPELINIYGEAGIEAGQRLAQGIETSASQATLDTGRFAGAVDNVGRISAFTGLRGARAFDQIAAGALLGTSSAQGLAIAFTNLGSVVATMELGTQAIGWATGIGIAAGATVLLIDYLKQLGQYKFESPIEKQFIDELKNLDLAGTRNQLDKTAQSAGQLEHPFDALRRDLIQWQVALGSGAGTMLGGVLGIRDAIRGAGEFGRVNALQTDLQKQQEQQLVQETRAAAQERQTILETEARSHLQITQTRIATESTAEAEAFRTGLSTFATYYEQRRAAIAAGTQAELQEIARERAALAASVTPLDFEMIGTGDQAHLQLRADVQRRIDEQTAQLDARARETRARDVQERGDLDATEAKSREELATRIAQINAQIATSDEARLTARIAQIRLEQEQVRRAAVQQVGPAQGAAVAQQFGTQQVGQAEFDSMQTRAERLFANLGRIRTEVQDQVNRGILTQAQAQGRVEDAEQATRGVLYDLLDGMEIMNALIGDPKNAEALAAIRTQYHGLTNDVDNVTVRMLRYAQSVATITSAIAQAIQSIPGVSQNLLDVVNGVDRAAQGLTGALAAGRSIQANGVSIANVAQLIPGIGGLVGGIMQTVGGLLADPEHDRLVRESNEIMQKNNQALDALTLKFSGFNPQAGINLSNAQRALTPQIISTIGLIPDFGQNRAAQQMSIFEAELHRFGLTFTQLDAIAKEYGITLRDSRGNIDPRALQALQKAIHDAAVAALSFADSLDDQRLKMDVQRSVFGTDTGQNTAVGDIQENLALLQHFSGSLAMSFGGLDATTEQGRAAIRAALEALYTEFVNGQITLEQLGGLSRDEFMGILKAVGDSLNSLATASDSVTEAFRNIPEAYKTAGAIYASQTIFTPQTPVTPQTAPTTPMLPVPQTPPETRPTTPAGQVTPSGAGTTSGSDTYVFSEGSIVFPNVSLDPVTLFRLIQEGARRIAATQFGSSARTDDALQS